jgi:signal transduction histidine kinase
MFARARRIAGIESGHVATITVVVLAYVVTLAGYLAERNTAEGAAFTATEFAVATALGVVYLALSVWGYELLDPILGRYTKAVYFITLTALFLSIEFLIAGSNGIWLISMPLVATAATDLPPWPRRLVYLAALLGMIVPLYVASGDWQVALFAGLTFSPAIVFVIVFVTITQKAELAQKEAESLAGQLAEANERLSAYAVQVGELATTQERNRLAREIHDNLGHFLTVANVQIKAAQAMIDRDPARAQLALDRAAQLTQDGLTAVRQSVASLRESPLGARPLPEAVAALAAETQAAGIVVEFTTAGRPRPLDPRAELTLYRAAQEGLTNVRKHARASRVDVRLDYGDPAAVALTLRDNGLGGDPAADGGGFGLLGLHERARQLGGHLTIDTAPGAGFCLVITLPMADGRLLTADDRPRATDDGPQTTAERPMVNN